MYPRITRPIESADTLADFGVESSLLRRLGGMHAAGLISAFVLPSTGLGSTLPPVVAYYTLACSIVRGSAGSQLPAIWLDGRVHPDMRRRGIGDAVLFDALGRCVDSTSTVAAAGILCSTDSAKASAWLCARSFTNLDDAAPYPRRHWLPIKVARLACDGAYGDE